MAIALLHMLIMLMIPVCAIALVVLLVVYHGRWAAYRDAYGSSRKAKGGARRGR